MLKKPEILFALEVVALPDTIKIELNDHGTYKTTETLSTGQKCNAILPILLLDSERPLLIDQPEDNLDNEFVHNIVVESVQEVKKSRQLIFVTHNPNIPVLSAPTLLPRKFHGQRSLVCYSPWGLDCV